ncbi:hypothetical protein [Endozoicomonas sp. 8E]|uniref:hypothetical protein n=1 Tax=Endozoicomonas sp. 8E TaxID=3035692 RepID=UPI0029393CD0|nr:hypothetical protein [Endozoicomonas sp. 8E]WOG26987.1 hypothetical protein P6910_20915 [Endozoicomonas sp. 8E]
MTRRYVVELQQDTASSNQSFSMNPYQRLLPYNTSDIANKDGFKKPDLPSDYKRQRFFTDEVKTTLIESISWQLLYAKNLLVTFELITTSKAPPLGTTSYSWLPLEGIVTVGWLLKSYWYPDSPLFKPTEQTEVRSTQGSQPFAITVMMHSSRADQQQSQLSESSGQQPPQATSQPTSSFANSLYSGSGDGYADPQQHSHTLGLDCFVHSCHGVCKFRSHSDSANERSNDPFAIQLQVHGIDDNPVNTTAPPVPIPCNLTMVDKDGQLRNCEKVYKSTQSLLKHQKRVHSGKKTCLAPVVGKDGRLQSCGEVWKNAGALSDHKRKAHTGQQTCKVIMVTEDDQERPCGKVCMNASALSSHKKSAHTRQQTCDVTVVGEGGQLQPCGTLCKSAQSLSCHKSRHHYGQKTCDVILVAEDGQQRPCGTVCKNVDALRYHKKSTHTGQQTCDVMMVMKNGERRPCGKVCKNSQALYDHKRISHNGQQTCDVMVVGEDGQPRPCGKVYKNVFTLSQHKGIHRKRKPFDANQKDGLSPP